jgi:LDH2 family malate/lactate/ureidoglycolate dehydrogenase
MASQTRYYAKPTEAAAFAQSLLVKSGLSEEHAELMSKCLVQADTRGVVRYTTALTLE